MGRMWFVLMIVGWCMGCSVVNNMDEYTFADDTETGGTTDGDTDADSDADTDADADTGEDTCGGALYVQCANGAVTTFNQCSEDLESEACPSHQECVDLTETTAECQCAGNWIGTDCSECAAGFADKGDNCGTCVRYVDLNASGTEDGLSWENAHTGVQGAIYNAQAAVSAADGLDACEVWIKAGTYAPTQGSGSNATFSMVDNVSLFGGFSDAAEEWDTRDFENNVTVLAGGGVYHVVTAAANTRMDGFTVTGGWAYADSSVENGQNGGGVFVDGDTVELANMVFSENAADLNGGAVFAMNGAAVTIESCTFLDNTAEMSGGAIAAQESTVTVAHCEFRNNVINHSSLDVGTGGAISMATDGTLTVSDSIFSGSVAGNSGGAIYALNSTLAVARSSVDGGSSRNMGAGVRIDGGTVSFERVYVMNNELPNLGSGGGIALSGVVDASFTNCVVAGNVVGTGMGNPKGGGIFAYNSNVTMVNSTVAYNDTNSADEPHAGGIYVDGGADLTLLNSIIWGNTCDDAMGQICGVEAAQASSSLWRATFSDIQGWDLNPADNNLNVDPLFVSISPLDLHLQDGSECVDGGTNAGAPDEDIDGIARPVGNGWDMGAYER